MKVERFINGKKVGKEEISKMKIDISVTRPVKLKIKK